MTTPPKPGWYPDPTGEPQSRYWDGIQWTSSTQFAGAPVPRGSSAGAKAALALAVLLGLVALVGGGVLAARVLFSAQGDDDSAVATTTSAGGSAGPCTFTPDGAPARPAPLPTDVATSGEYEVELATSVGRVAFVADAAQVPCALASLRSLAQAGYFDGTPCHRLTTAGIKVLQCGDPTGTGSGGPGYVFDDEALEGATYPSGTVAMANRGPGTNGSQFFLVYEDSQLPPDYTPLGRITAGLDVLQRVAAGGTDDANGPGDGRPRTPVVLEQVTVRAR